MIKSLTLLIALIAIVCAGCATKPVKWYGRPYFIDKDTGAITEWMNIEVGIRSDGEVVERYITTKPVALTKEIRESFKGL